MPKISGLSTGEILIIISVIIILALMIVPNFLRTKAMPSSYQCQSNCKNIGIALSLYAKENSGHYPDKLVRIEEKHIKLIPTCASAGNSTVYTTSYTSAMYPDAFTFYCAGNNHSPIGLKPNFPQFTSGRGLKSR